MKKLVKQVAELIFPAHCLVCGRGPAGSLASGCGDHGICPDCLTQVTFLQPPFCRICGQTMAGITASGLRCGKCHRFPPPYDLARSLVHYDSPVKELIARLKYQEDTSVLRVFRHLAEISDLHEFSGCDVYLPVPLHPDRLRKRGLNQSLELAKCMFPSRKSDILPNVLTKLRNTPVQTGMDGVERRKNLRGSFGVKVPQMVQNRNVGLVDDVFTTGTTVAACSRALKKSGAKEIRVVTLARVVFNST